MSNRVTDDCMEWSKFRSSLKLIKMKLLLVLGLLLACINCLKLAQNGGELDELFSSPTSSTDKLSEVKTSVKKIGRRIRGIGKRIKGKVQAKCQQRYSKKLRANVVKMLEKRMLSYQVVDILAQANKESIKKAYKNGVNWTDAQNQYLQIVQFNIDTLSQFRKTVVDGISHGIHSVPVDQLVKYINTLVDWWARNIGKPSHWNPVHNIAPFTKGWNQLASFIKEKISNRIYKSVSISSPFDISAFQVLSDVEYLMRDQEQALATGLKNSQISIFLYNTIRYFAEHPEMSQQWVSSLQEAMRKGDENEIRNILVPQVVLRRETFKPEKVIDSRELAAEKCSTK